MVEILKSNVKELGVITRSGTDSGYGRESNGRMMTQQHSANKSSNHYDGSRTHQQ